MLKEDQESTIRQLQKELDDTRRERDHLLRYLQKWQQWAAIIAWRLYWVKPEVLPDDHAMRVRVATSLGVNWNSLQKLSKLKFGQLL
jgi:hypothetical protein